MTSRPWPEQAADACHSRAFPPDPRILRDPLGHLKRHQKRGPKTLNAATARRGIRVDCPPRDRCHHEQQQPSAGKARPGQAVHPH